MVRAQLSELGDSKALVKKCVELEASQAQTKKALWKLKIIKREEIIS